MNPAPARQEPISASILVPRLRANLSAQMAGATELEPLLAQERERLMARDWEAILQLSEAKERVIQRLAALGRELDELAAGRPLLPLLEDAGLSAQQATLGEIAARLQRANRESRALLDHHHARVGTALRLLNRGDAAGTYGRGGYAGTGRLSQRLALA